MAKPRANPESEPPPSFETQLSRLEELVRSLEGEELGLESGVERFREGVEMLKGLSEALAGAEQRVQELTTGLRRELEELERAGDAVDGDGV
ncbi:MAG: exodeoxyribonuclease VII small subunit [Planctomycetota bacterium]|nr:exodeoxyribonuclease VII small subunit [Planctomycetota bacterium]